MPGQILLQANPPADSSLLPDSVLELGVQLDTKNYLSDDELKSLKLFRRTADYIAAAMIFLNHNVLVERDITPEDIKARLLGHWGTCPGLVMVYAHLNRLIRKTDLNALYVVGPGQCGHCVLTRVAKFLRPRRSRHPILPVDRGLALRILSANDSRPQGSRETHRKL
jgi:xylulose-5-phosphate/fructose-6-phosphate phosphoketolase